MAEHLRFDARRFIARAWQLARPYWSRSDERPLAWSLLLTIIGISLGLVYIAVLLNKWNRDFFNAIEARNYGEFLHLLTYLCVLAAIYILAAVLRAYLRQLLYKFAGASGSRASSCAIGSGTRSSADSSRMRGAPTIRTSGSAKTSGSSPTRRSHCVLDLLQQVVTVISFLAILWTVSGPLEFTFAGDTWSVPGYMVWTAFIYAVVGTMLTYFVGRPLVRLNFLQERYEADLRFSLVRVTNTRRGSRSMPARTPNARSSTGVSAISSPTGAVSCALRCSLISSRTGTRKSR